MALAHRASFFSGDRERRPSLGRATIGRASVGVVVLALLAGACSGKPNPKLSTLTKDPAQDGADTEEFEFTYDSSNRLSQVDRSEGSGSTSWELTWDGSLLAKVTVREDVGTEIEETEVELTWEGGRLIAAKTDVEGDNVQDVTFSYDDNGRLSETKSESDDEEDTTTLDYNSDGALASIENESRNTEFDTTTSSSLELERDGARVTALSFDTEGSDGFTFEYEYDDEKNRVAAITADIETQIGGEPTVVTSVSEFAYDDQGRVESIEQTGEVDNVTADIATIELTYDDGDASSLDVTPNEIFLLGVLFDLKGGSVASLDNTTGVPRLAFPSW